MTSIATLPALSAALMAAAGYNATVEFRMEMGLAADVAYTVDLYSTATPADALAPCSYLVGWEAAATDSSDSSEGSKNTDRGFAAYFDGHFYSFRGGRLAEQHFPLARPTVDDDDGGTPVSPLSAQFAWLLPQLLGAEVAAIAASPGYSWHLAADTIVDGRRAVALTARQAVGTATARELLYAFDAATAMPLRVEVCNNPGCLAEQVITVSYRPPRSPLANPLTERTLAAMYPDAFSRFRTSTFTIDNLPGQPLPRFALPTLGGGRYAWPDAGAGRRQPMLLALLDPEAGFARATVEAVRAAARRLPYNATIVWAATGNDRAAIATLLAPRPPGPESPGEGPERPGEPDDADGPRLPDGEVAVVAAQGLARDCGAALLPAVVVVDADGRVADVAVGYGPSLASTLLVKAAILR